MEVSEEQFELPAHLSHNGSSIGRLNSLLNAPTGTSEGPKLQAPRSFTIIGAAYRGDISLHGALQDVFSARWNDAIEIVPVDRIELNRFQRAGNSNDLLCRERDQIWIAAHETEEFSVVVTVAMSDEHKTPRPPAPFAQCSTVPPGKCPPQRISATSGRSC